MSDLPKGLFKFSEGIYIITEQSIRFNCKDEKRLVEEALKAMNKYAFRKGYEAAEENVRHVVAMINIVKKE